MKALNFNLEILKKQNYNSDIKIIPTETFEKLLGVNFPIKKEFAIKQVSEFLMYLNILIEENETYNELVIEQEVFIKYFSRDTYVRFKEILKEIEVLTPIGKDIPGSYCLYDYKNKIAKSYQVYSTYVKLDKYTLLFFDRKKETVKNIDFKCSLNEKMLNTLTNENLDYQQVFEKEIAYHIEMKTSTFSLVIRLSRALSINCSRWAKFGTKVKRIYHSFSNLSRVTRKCFETSFNCIDLKNAQPTLLLCYLVKMKLDFEQEYKTACESGQFYELFTTSLDMTRDAVKLECYSSIFFDFKIKSIVNRKFKTMFPKLWQILKDIDETKEISLASILQNTEAEIFNNLTVKHSSKFYTLFDAIYFNNIKDKTVIEKQLLKIQKKLGIKFTLTFE